MRPDLETLRLDSTAIDAADLKKFLTDHKIPSLRQFFIDELGSQEVRLLPEFAPSLKQILIKNLVPDEK